MSITSLSGIGGLQQQQAIQNASKKLQAVIATIASGNVAQDVAQMSIASELKSQTSALKQVSSNITQAQSLTQVAEGGAQQIQNLLQQNQALAQQAQSPTLNAENRAQLNQQFQKNLQQIDQIASGTTFNSKPLLNGDLSGADALSLDSILSSDSGGSGDLSISSLSSSSLLGGANINILSADSAGQALNSINDALNNVISTRADIGSFQSVLGFAAANVDTAFINQEAAMSTLSDTDIAGASIEASLANIQRQASIAVAAQGNKLSPTLLRLIG